MFSPHSGHYTWGITVEFALCYLDFGAPESLPAFSAGAPPEGWSPRIDFAGQMENTGHFLHPTAIAIGQTVMANSLTRIKDPNPTRFS